MISKHDRKKHNRVVGLLVACVLGAVSAVNTWAADAGPIQVNLGEAVTITADKVQAVAIADPSIADVATLSDKELSVIGKKVGVTTLTISHIEGGATEVRRVEVGYDSPAATIKEMIGAPDIRVRVIGDTLVLDGRVNNEVEAARAAQVATAYKDKVLNLLEVTNPRQIRIRTRICEVRSEALKQVGISYFRDGVVRYGYGRVEISEGGSGSFAGHSFLDPVVQNSTISLGSTPVGLEATLRLLESRNFVRVLSEPTLVTMSGKEASFLAGGEAPIVQQLQNTFTVEFKEFGVRMKIKPTADSANNITTHLVAEVSDVNPTVTVQGVPSFTTRRAETDVQLKDGQTLAIGGLFNSNNSRDALRKFPWLGNIPVLGTLFRSKDYQKNQSELLFFVTVEIVKDIDAETAAAPRTPLMKEFNKQSQSLDSELAPPKDHGLMPEIETQPKTQDQGPMSDQTKSNYTPARPAAP